MLDLFMMLKPPALISPGRRWLTGTARLSRAAGLVRAAGLTRTAGLSILLSFVLAAGAPLGGATARAGDDTAISVPISTVRSANGTVFVALYDRDNWLKPHQFLAARKVNAHRGTVYATFRGVRPGRYGVAVFHDENNNGRVDTNVVGLPKEGFGFSRTTPLRRPSFDETSFEVRSQAHAPVHLRY